LFCAFHIYLYYNSTFHQALADLIDATYLMGNSKTGVFPMKISGGLKVVPPGKGQTLMMVGGRYTFLASGEDTGGAYALIEMVLPPAGGPPPHIHEREEESFYVLEGTLQFQVGDESVTAGAGTYVKTPRGVPHALKNVGTTPARALVLVTPSGIEKYFAEIGQPVGEMPSANTLEKAKEVAPRYGITLLTGD
jgi:quercetin dioxygenase-like cupin family protein